MLGYRSGLVSAALLATCAILASGQSDARTNPVEGYPLHYGVTWWNTTPAACAYAAGVAFRAQGVRISYQQSNDQMGEANNFSAAVVCLPEENGVGIFTATASTNADSAVNAVNLINARMSAFGPPVEAVPPAVEPRTGEAMVLQLGTFPSARSYIQLQTAAINAMKELGLTVNPMFGGIVGHNDTVTVVVCIIQTAGVSSDVNLPGKQNVIVLAASTNSATAEAFRNKIRTKLTTFELYLPAPNG